MKFLIDRCTGGKLAKWLRDKGHDVLESRELGPDPGDRELLGIAAEQGRILVTIDTDFGRLAHLENVFHCGIVRLPDVPAERRIILMDVLLRDHVSDLRAQSIITIRGERIRISKPPKAR